jgi:hypothetical protein
MMRKLLLVSVLTMSIAGMAQADLYTQTIDFRTTTTGYWNGMWDSATYGKYIAEDARKRVSGVWYNLDNDPFDYQHNIAGVLGAGDTLNGATVSLYFIDDETDSGNANSNSKETVRLTFEAGNVVSLGETDSGSQGPYNVLASLTDRILNVSVELVGGSDEEDIFLKMSTLCLDYTPYVPPVTPTPVPAAFLLGALGLGTAGIKLRRFAR